MTISRPSTRVWPTLALLGAASFALAGCGSSEKASEGATADTVELPAEEAMAQISAVPSEAPTELATIIATDEGMDTSAAMDSAAAMDTGASVAADD